MFKALLGAWGVRVPLLNRLLYKYPVALPLIPTTITSDLRTKLVWKIFWSLLSNHSLVATRRIQSDTLQVQETFAICHIFSCFGSKYIWIQLKISQCLQTLQIDKGYFNTVQLKFQFSFVYIRFHTPSEPVVSGALVSTCMHHGLDGYFRCECYTGGPRPLSLPDSDTYLYQGCRVGGKTSDHSKISDSLT